MTSSTGFQKSPEVYSLFCGQAFEAINHFGYCIPSTILALAEVDKDALDGAENKCCKEKARRGHPVLDGDRKRHDKQGNVIGAKPLNMNFAERDRREYFLGRWKPKRISAEQAKVQGYLANSDKELSAI